MRRSRIFGFAALSAITVSACAPAWLDERRRAPIPKLASIRPALV
jgi:hypothetical protein